VRRKDIYREADDWVFAVGRLNMDLKALTRTVNGTITNPIILEGEDGEFRCVFEGAPFFRINSKGEEVECVQMKKSEMLNPKRKVLSIANSDGFNVRWLQLELWDKIAIFVHRNCRQGDLIGIVAKKKVHTAQDNATINTIYNVYELQLLSQSKKRTRTIKYRT